MRPLDETTKGEPGTSPPTSNGTPDVTTEPPGAPGALAESRIQRLGWGLAHASLFATVTFLLWMMCRWLLASIPPLNDRFMLALLALLPAVLASTALLLRFPAPRPLTVIGLEASGKGFQQLGFGVVLGGGLVLAIVGIQWAAGWVLVEAGSGPSSAQQTWEPSFLAGFIGIAIGAAGEELLFRGYGFQQLIRATNPWITVVGTSVLFGIVHDSNPDFSRVALLNTILFGMIFGLALVRHRTLWLPYGMHFGWNIALAAIGANLSGLRIKLTGLTVVPVGPSYWTGDAYGPEASLLTTLAVVAAGLIIWKAPVRRSPGPLLWD